MQRSLPTLPTLLTIGLLFCILSFNAAAQKDENAVFYECYGRALAGNFDSSKQFCQCENDLALERMRPADWEKYSKDYDAFRQRTSSSSKFDPHTYEESLALINSACIRCKENNYKNCLRNNPNTLSPARIKAMATNLQYGQFDLVKKDTAYSHLFSEVISAYSDQCRDHIPEPRWRFYSQDKFGHEQEGDTIVNDRYVDAYESHNNKIGTSFLGEMISDTLGAVARGELPTPGLKWAVDLSLIHI